MLLITTYTGEIWDLFVFDPKFLFCLAFSGIMGIIITCAVLMVCTICSPVAFNITGNLKDVVLTYVGFVFFNDAMMTLMVGIGLFFSFMGAGSYAFDSYLKEKSK